MQGWSKAYGLDDESSTSQTIALRLSGSKINTRVLYFAQTRVMYYTQPEHGNSTTMQYEMYRDGKAIFMNERRRTKNVQLDPFVRPALEAAGCVAKSLSPVQCANG